VEFKALNLVEGLCRQVAFPTMGAAHHWDVLYHEQIFPLAVGSGNPTDARTLSSTNVTYYLTLSRSHSLYTVIMTSLPVGLSLAIISTSSPSRVSPLMWYFHSAVTISF